MATRSSTLKRSKAAENRVSRYLWGPDHLRDWKEDYDLSGPDADGRVWVGEVKNYAWASGPGQLYGLMLAALEQAEKHSDRAFACYIPKNCQPEAALVMHRVNGQPVIVPAREFRAQTLGLAPGEEEK